MDTSSAKAGKIALAIGRIGMAWIFLWPFFDKTFGLGFATAKENAWVRGGHPTEGFLKFGSDPNGPLHGLFTNIAGHPITDILFMVGLLCIGVALLLGVGMRIAAWSGITMLVLMWVAIIPLDKGTDHNPFWDDHLQYAVFLAVYLWPEACNTWSLAHWWRKQPIVQKHGWLE